MNKLTTTAIFLITGLVTAAGANPEHPMLAKTKSQLLDEQYEAALYTAEQIIEHYPDTDFAKSAQRLIDIINKRKAGSDTSFPTNGSR